MSKIFAHMVYFVLMVVISVMMCAAVSVFFTVQWKHDTPIGFTHAPVASFEFPNLQVTEGTTDAVGFVICDLKVTAVVIPENGTLSLNLTEVCVKNTGLLRIVLFVPSGHSLYADPVLSHNPNDVYPGNFIRYEFKAWNFKPGFMSMSHSSK